MPRFIVEITRRTRATDSEPGVPDLTWVGGAEDNTTATEKAYEVWEQRYAVTRPRNADVRVVQLGV